MNPALIQLIGAAAGKFATIIAEAVKNGWDEDRVIAEIKKEEIVSTAGLQSMRDADAVRDAYVED